MSEEFEVTAVISNASPRRVYDAWLSSEEHAAMTGGATATCDPVVGGRHTAWDGYIEGVNVALEPNRRVVQTWRSTEFPDDAPDSQIEVLLEDAEGGAATTIILRHTEIPDGQGDSYKQG